MSFTFGRYRLTPLPISLRVCTTCTDLAACGDAADDRATFTGREVAGPAMNPLDLPEFLHTWPLNCRS